MILYFVCLVLTLAIESVALLIWSAFRGLPGRTFDLCLLLVGMNCVTHPLAWWVLAWWNSSFFFALMGIEIAVILVEASILNRLGGLPWSAGFLLSLTCNLASLLIGVSLIWLPSFI